MIALLDTNVCIAIMREPMEADKLIALLTDGPWTEAIISSISLYELEMGVVGRVGEARARASLKTLLDGPIRIEPFDEVAARSSAGIGALARSRGRQLSAMDTLIAGHASALEAALVTNDVRLAETVASEVAVVSWR